MDEVAVPAIGRREARRIDRRDAILAVAATSFLEHGYAGTTMSAIAATIGGSKATLWNYFPSKEDLFEAVLDKATTAFRAELSTLLDACDDAGRTLRSFCLRYVEKVTRPEAIALHRLVISETGRFPEIGKIFYERAPRPTQALLADFIAEAGRRGQLRVDNPLRAARALMHLCLLGMHQQLLLARMETPTVELAEADVDAAMDVFLRAYGP